MYFGGHIEATACSFVKNSFLLCFEHVNLHPDSRCLAVLCVLAASLYGRSSLVTLCSLRGPPAGALTRTSTGQRSFEWLQNLPCSNRSILPAHGPTAANPPHAAAAVGRWDRPTDRRTDTVPLHRPCHTALPSPGRIVAVFIQAPAQGPPVPALWDSAGCSCGCRVPSSGAVATVQRVRRRLSVSTQLNCKKSAL